MKKYLLAVITSITICMVGVSAQGHEMDVDVHYDSDHDIHIRNGNVVIDLDNTNNEATITQTGQLFINGRNIPVTGQQKDQLAAYVSTVKDIESRGIQIGKDAISFSADIVGEVFADLFSGDDDKAIDQNTKARTHQFKQKILPICDDVAALIKIQDELNAGIPAFRPYAVVKDKDAADCRHDVNSDD